MLGFVVHQGYAFSDCGGRTFPIGVEKMVIYDVSKALVVFLAALIIIALAVLLGFAAHWCSRLVWNRIGHVVMDRWMRVEDVIARRPWRRRPPVYRIKRLGCGVINTLYRLAGSQHRYMGTSYLEDIEARLAARARKILKKKGALRRHTRFQQSCIDRLVNDQEAILFELHGLNIFTTGDIRHRQLSLEKRLQRIHRDLRELDPSRIDHSHYMSFDDEG